MGAYVWINEKFERFDGWTDDGRVKVLNSTETYPAKDVLAATSIVYGIPHENGIIMPSSGLDADHVTMVRYAAYNATVKVKRTGRTTTIGVNHLAILVPVLNPATEKTAARAERLARELERVKETLHRRMVAEGEARSWCSEFDPILDSNGLKPRKPKAKVRGTLSFEYEVDTPIPAQTLTKLLNGTVAASNHIPMSAVKVTAIEQTDPIYTPVLS
jgi:hypothetical protein